MDSSCVWSRSFLLNKGLVACALNILSVTLWASITCTFLLNLPRRRFIINHTHLTEVVNTRISYQTSWGSCSDSYHRWNNNLQSSTICVCFSSSAPRLKLENVLMFPVNVCQTVCVLRSSPDKEMLTNQSNQSRSQAASSDRLQNEVCTKLLRGASVSQIRHLQRLQIHKCPHCECNSAAG